MQLFKHSAFLLLCLLAFAQNAQAQATLSVQGTIQKSTGIAVDDGDYAITFKLYTTETGGTPIWSETQDPVDIIGGVYSVTLGSVNPLTIPFNQPYFLGISVGTGQEHTPRARLTSAPYALSLLGQDNKFPSTGNVGIGTTAPTTTLDAKGSISTATVTTSAAAYTVAAADHVIFLDLAGAQSVTLPSAVTFPRREIVLINKTSTAKTVSSYVNLAGAAATAIPANGMIELRSNGTEWRLATTFAPPSAGAAKAYVLAGPVNGFIYAPSTQSLLQLTEVEDAQNCFASNTFTAPRTGYHRISSRIFGGMTGSFPSNGYVFIRCQGTCAFGAASRTIYGYPQVSGTTQMSVNFSTDVYMTAGQTLFLQFWHNGSTAFTFNDITDNYLSILEQ